MHMFRSELLLLFLWQRGPTRGPRRHHTTSMSRRRGRQLSKSERRDVRWALEQAPNGNVRAVDVHGVYVVFNH